MNNNRRAAALFPELDPERARREGRVPVAAVMSQLGGAMGRTILALPLMDLAVVTGILLLLAN